MLDTRSWIVEHVHVNERIAARVRALRSAQALSLEALSLCCGVSRSMLSLIERGESSPTAVVLEKIATGLHVPMASLFEQPPGDGEPVLRRTAQPVWRDPQSGYLRRAVSPPDAGSPIQIVEVSFPAGARVEYETGQRTPRVHQQVWVLQGAIDVTVGERTHALARGDCLAMQLVRPVSFHNATPRIARYAVIVASEPARS